jgi:putative transposase
MLKETSALTQIEVYAYCFVPDHVHLLVGSGEDGADLIDFVKRFKQKTGWWFSNRYVPSGSLKASPTDPAAAKRSIGLWQKSYYDHIVRSNENIRAAAEYIIANPVQAGLTREPGEYPFAGSFVWPDIYQR